MTPYRTAAPRDPLPPYTFTMYLRETWRSLGLALFVAASLSACTAAQGRAVEGIALSLGETACEALLPIAVPGYGALDVLGCKGAEAAIAGILAAVTPPATTAPSALSGGGAAFTSAEPHRPLRVKGRVTWLVRADAATVARAQAMIDRGAR